MPKQKTIAEVKARIAKTENDIRQGENKVKRLLQQNSQQERKDRTRRLIERGAILESLIPDAVILSNEQIKTLLRYALDTGAAKEIMHGYSKALSRDVGAVN